MRQTFTIGQMARRAGVGVATVRFYERQGLIAAPAWGAFGYRQYPEETVVRLGFIRRAKALGFSLREIRVLLALRVNATMSSGEVKARAQAKIANIEEKIRTLMRMKEALIRLTTACDGDAPVRDCPILETLDAPGQEPV
jgi:Cu(I)-responsive transcriptional regulator